MAVRLRGGEGQLGSWLSLSVRRRLFRERVRGPAQFAPLRKAYEELRPSSLPRMIQQQTKEADQAQVEHRDREAQIRETLGRYRVTFGGGGPSGAHVQIIGEIKPWVEENVRALKESELIQYRRQADEAADQIGRLFRTAFVHELNSRFSIMRTELENLGKGLKSRPLHNETYTLHAHVKPEFEALHRLARESEEDEGTLSALFGRGVPRDEAQAQALREVEKLLNDPTLDFAIYEDYRKYFSFDLQMQDISSGRKTSFIAAVAWQAARNAKCPTMSSLVLRFRAFITGHAASSPALSSAWGSPCSTRPSARWMVPISALCLISTARSGCRF